MGDFSSAIFYSTWNESIAVTIRRYPTVDIYHINDYHDSLAHIYPLPIVLLTCLSLLNAKFQGLYQGGGLLGIQHQQGTLHKIGVQFGNTVTLLLAGASFISIHQKSVGVAGVSDKYNKCS
jgi:alpha-1,3-glucan synthase